MTLKDIPLFDGVTIVEGYHPLSEYQQKYPPYRGRFELSHGIEDDHIWSARNYVSMDWNERRVKKFTRQPYYIVDDPVRMKGTPRDQIGTEIIPIFMPVEVKYIRDTLLDFFEYEMRLHHHNKDFMSKTHAGVARRFDHIDDWPIYSELDRARRESFAPSRGVWLIREKANMNLGRAVADILLWHGIIYGKDMYEPARPRDAIVLLDQARLDQWAVSATLIAENAIEKYGV